MNYYDFRKESPVDALLDKEGCTLDMLLDEPDLLQECKSQNPRLIDFLIDPIHLEQLIKYVAVIPEADCDEKHKKKFPVVCREILCAEIWTITDALFANQGLLKLLFSFLEIDPNDETEEQAKITEGCTKVICSLIMIKLEETVMFLRTIPNCVSKFVKHISNSNVVEVILKLITHDGRLTIGTGPVNWLCEENFVEQLLDKFISVDDDYEMQDHIAQTFQELISYASFSATDHQVTPQIIARIESEPVTKAFFSTILQSKNDNVILNSLKILGDLLQRYRQHVYEEQDPSKLSTVVTVSASHFSDFKVFLLKKCCLPPHINTFGVIDPPLGRVRQAMIELIEATLRTNNSFVFNAILSSDLLPTILDLFFQYKWNNFLHQSVFSMLSVLLQSPNERIIRLVIIDCHLLDRILAAETENEKYYSTTNISLGYVAFLTKLSLLIDGLVQHHPFVHDILCSRPDWQKYVNDILAPRNSRESRLLGGGLRYSAESTDDDDDGDLNRSDEFGDWFFERPSEDDENGDETLELIQSDGNFVEDGGDQDGIRCLDSDSDSDSDDETIVKRDLTFDDSDNEDPFPSSSDCPDKE